MKNTRFTFLSILCSAIIATNAYADFQVNCSPLLPHGAPATFTAPGSCSVTSAWSTGGGFLSSTHHFNGTITHNYSNFVVDASSAGKRMVKAAATVTMSYVPGTRSPSAQDVSAHNGGGYLDAPKQVYQYYCPDKANSAFVDATGSFQDPYTACAAQGNMDTYLMSHGCPQEFAIDYGGNIMTPYGQCYDDGKQPYFSNDGNSIFCCPSGFDISPFNAQYQACLQHQIQLNNQLPATSDCYCNDHTKYFKFDASTPELWRCTQCPPGLVQNKDGTGCMSNCPAGQSPDAAGVCSSCDLTVNEIVPATGQCLPQCTPPTIRVGSTCTQVCPTGMIPDTSQIDPISGLPITKCTCNDTRFMDPSTLNPPAAGTSVRFPAFPQTVGGINGFFYSAAINGATTNAACVCGTATGSVTLWDQSSVINKPVPTFPYGQAALLLPQVPNTPDKYVCGCPNYNEKFGHDPITGAWHCLPTLKGSVYLVSLDPAKNLADNGVVTAQTEQPTLTKAFLRGSTTDVSESYDRRIWRCAPGTFLDSATNTCTAVTVAALPQMKCDDGAGQLIPSSTTDTAITDFLASPDGAGKTFANITNKRLACCLSNKQDPTVGTKYHCAVSPPPTSYPAATAFDDYYDYAGGDTTLDAGVTKPNRFYLVGADKKPVIGIFHADGSQCTYSTAMTPSQQMDFLSIVARNAKDPAKRAAPMAGVVGAPVGDPKCRYVVRAAIQVFCPAVGGTDPATGLPLNNTLVVGGSTRCGTASSLTVHYDVIDFNDPLATHQMTLKEVNSLSGNMLNPAMDVKKLIGQ